MNPAILPNLPEVLVIPETSKILRCSDSMTYQLIADGKLKAIAFSTSKQKKSRRSSLRVLADDLREFILTSRNGRGGGR